MNEELKELRFFSIDEILYFHSVGLEYGGGPRGIRDANQLDSAIHAPWNRHSYTGCGIHEIAACYAFSLAEAQAFLDGNKRVAVIAAVTFLVRHGYVIDNALPIYNELIGIAAHTATLESLRDCMEGISRPGSLRWRTAARLMDKLIHSIFQR